MVVHFLAGATVAIATVLIIKYFLRDRVATLGKFVWPAITTALIIGVIWELYELHFGLTHLSDGVRYIRDTTSDISMDICGGILGALYSINFLQKTNV